MSEPVTPAASATQAAAQAAALAARNSATEPNMMLWMIGGGIAVAIVIGAIMLLGRKGSPIQKRLERVGGKKKSKAKAVNSGPSTARRSETDSSIPFFDRLIKTILPNPDKLRARLERTGREISIGVYLLINALCVMVFFLLLNKLVGLELAGAGLLGLALGMILPHLFVDIMGRRRVAKFIASFPEAIDAMCRGLRSGLPISESMAAVGREMPDPIGIEFRRITDAVRIGKSMDTAMWEVAERIDAPEYRFLIISMSIQRETGGNLAETLGNLADLIRRRRQLKLKIKAMSSEARASAMIIGALPFIMFTILWIVSREYILTLVQTEQGHKLIVLALVLMGIGHGTIAKMIRFDY